VADAELLGWAELIADAVPLAGAGLVSFSIRATE
jgi:hypothetical protein